MRVIASKDKNYSLSIDSSEFDYIDYDDTYQTLIVSYGCSTFPSYKDIPTLAIKNQLFNNLTHQKTRTFENETQFLLSLDLAFSVQLQEPILIQLIPPNNDYIFDGNTVYLHGMPQIFELTTNGYVVGIDGNYDFVTGWFSGIVRFADDYKTSSN